MARDLKRLEKHLADRAWRLNNLYFIKDEHGNRVQFQMNWAQEELYRELHYLNLILKGRQLGMTTFIQLFILDQCLFNLNLAAATVALEFPRFGGQLGTYI